MERLKEIPMGWVLPVALTLAFLFVGVVLTGCSDDCSPTAPVVQEREDDDEDCEYGRGDCGGADSLVVSPLPPLPPRLK